MKQRIGIPDIGPMIGILLVAVAAGVGSGLVFAPEIVVPSTVEVATLLLVTAVALRLERDPIVRSWVWKLAAGALLLRGLALVFVHGPLDPYFFAPDALSYEMMGQELRDFWMRGAPYPSSLEGEWQVAYPYLNGFFYLFLDDVAVAGAVLNTFFGVWTVILTFYLGRELLGEQAGKLASGMVAIFPSMGALLVRKASASASGRVPRAASPAHAHPDGGPGDDLEDRAPETEPRNERHRDHERHDEGQHLSQDQPPEVVQRVDRGVGQLREDRERHGHQHGEDRPSGERGRKNPVRDHAHEGGGDRKGE